MAKKSSKRPRYKIFAGGDGFWGVEEGGAVLYEPEFLQETARAIVEMEQSESPPKDWEETADRLEDRGLRY